MSFVCIAKMLIVVTISMKCALDESCPCGALFFDNDVTMSETGIQQGDSLGSVLFALSIDDIVWSVTSPIDVWYIDNSIIDSSTYCVKHDVVHIIPALARIGHDIDLWKFEVVNISCFSIDDVVLVLEQELLEENFTQIEDLVLLGAPLRDAGCRSSLLAAPKQLKRMSERHSDIVAYSALKLPRYSSSVAHRSHSTMFQGYRLIG